MGKDKGQPGGKRNATDVWEEIDSTVITVVGKRVFYQLKPEEGGVDPLRTKSLAFVTGPGNPERDGQGRIQSFIVVFPRDGAAAFTTLAPLSSGREPGTYDLAKDGDLTN